ncbi:MAG: response regulator [Chloroflexota bacterium]|nr:response regulator [Chloroflexota bacterium]
MKKRILVVGENWEAQMLATCALESAGYDAITLFDRRNAVRAVQDMRPDLVLLDMGLPKLRSWQIVRSLRRDRQTQSVPIIGIMPEDEQVESAAFANRGGLVDVFHRPLDSRLLIRKVRRALRDDRHHTDQYQQRAAV